MKNFSCFFSFLWLLLAIPLSGQSLQVSISIEEPHICGISDVTLEITNNSPGTIQLQGIYAHLNNKQEGLITLLGLKDSPGFQVVAGLGTSYAIISYDQQIPLNETKKLTMQIRYSCDFFDILNNLNGYFVQAEVRWQQVSNPPSVPPSAPFTTTVQTDEYKIKYSYITPQVNLEAITATYEKPFDIKVPLEISGDYCDKDFTVSLKSRSESYCYNYNNLSYSLVRGQSTFDPVPLPSMLGPDYSFVVNTQPGVPNFCTDNYTQGMGELTLIIHGVVVPCGCGESGNSYGMTIGFTPCDINEVPADCLENGQLKPVETTIQEITFVTPKSGTLEITNNDNASTFNLYNTQNTLKLKVTNTSTLYPVYNVELALSGQLGYNPTKVEFSNTPPDVLENPNPSAPLTLSFSDINLSNIGLEDLNNDGSFAELAPGNSFTLTVFFDRPPGCALGSSEPCRHPCEVVSVDVPVVKAEVKWNNICNSLSPGIAVYQHNLGVSPATMNVKYGVGKLDDGIPRKVTMDLKFAKMSGFEGYLNQGPLRHYICIKSNIINETNIAYSNLRIKTGNNEQQIINPVINNGFLDLGPVQLDQFGNIEIESISFDFIVTNCDPNLKVIELDLAYGVFFPNPANSGNCYIQMGCGDARFLSPCSELDPTECTLFADLTFQTKNTQAASVTPLKAYPCDCIRIDVEAVVGEDHAGQLVVGGLIHENFTEYFKNGGFQGEITVNGLPVTFLQREVEPKEPELSAIYFRSENMGSLAAGDVISGYFELCLNSLLPNDAGALKKMDFFAPAMGVKDGDAPVELCFTGFEDLYALNVGYIVQENHTASCANGGQYAVKLIKTGGELYGPDFPGVPRVVANIVSNNVLITLDNGTSTAYKGRGGHCADLGNPFFVPQNAFSTPTGQEKAGDLLQSFTAQYDENCAGNLPVHHWYTIEIRPGEQNGCQGLEPQIGTSYAATAALPKIISKFDPFLGSKETIIDNTYTFKVETTNNGGEAAMAWIQLEYDPSKIEIDPAWVGPEALVVNGQCGNQVLVIPLGNFSANASVEHNITVKFLEPSCPTTMVSLYGFHHCKCIPVAYTCAANYTDPQGCRDSHRDFTFEFLGSGLDLNVKQCTVQGNCDQKTYKAVFEINNFDQGNTSDINFMVMLPLGVTIYEARYGFGNGCSVVQEGEQPDEKLAEPTGWTPDPATLFGIQSNQPDTKRKRLLSITFNGMGADPANDDVEFICKGITPCGKILERKEKIKDVSAKGILEFVPANWCKQMPEPMSVTVKFEINVLSSAGYLQLLNYSTAKIVCDANNNGKADIGEPIIFSYSPPLHPSNMSHQFQIHQSQFDPQKYVGSWNIPAKENENLKFCENGNAILIIEGAFFGLIFDPEISFCVSPAIGKVCDSGGGYRLSGTSTIADQQLQTKVQPNPFEDRLNVLVTAGKSTYATISLLNQLGARVYTNTYPLVTDSDNNVALDLGALPSGAYILCIATENGMQWHKVVKH